METALLAAISMGRDLLHKNVERTSVTNASSESDRNPDKRVTPPCSRVLGFHQDEDGHWVVALSCGHTQHLRHLPPWQSRAWVLDAEQRQQRIGQPFACGWCAQGADSDTLEH
ncbi:DUF3565 domain-containing protein [Pseudomonas alkylphenolica]|uniref:DUF3565 domain-containing protein n=1 Tax=Pseudomonas alkylphenolica TaxID=237609 RepID=A0A443ZXP3_9PSED|nr:DUF3565 domain-containing protein [Pseudomonas alkylphenolica]RWU25731.1 DUF3565 domain-containing protein [Pseudomonas alkylphenolica]